jgi:hypothetical protein
MEKNLNWAPELLDLLHRWDLTTGLLLYLSSFA